MTRSPAQDWNASSYAKNARFVADLATDVFSLLGPCPGERILDLGCGDGVLTQRLQGIGVDALGVDSSPDLIEAARKSGVKAQVGDGQNLHFDQEFDAVFSNAALHWMRDSAAVIDGVYRALKPGGRFVAECGGAGNVKTIVAAIDRILSQRGYPGLVGNPWVFADAREYRALLESRGFEVLEIGLHERPTRLPGDVGGWLDTFADSFLRVLPFADRRPARDAVVNALRPEICDRGGVWWADYVRLRFSARRP
ncbi:MAG: methyltransferase domain-containing protein [Alphaproteobacteria bacterium]|nr:methyltransferase domain-containing protein [Alphaproteobacteria bacterium]